MRDSNFWHTALNSCRSSTPSWLMSNSVMSLSTSVSRMRLPTVEVRAVCSSSRDSVPFWLESNSLNTLSGLAQKSSGSSSELTIWEDMAVGFWGLIRRYWRVGGDSFEFGFTGFHSMNQL